MAEYSMANRKIAYTLGRGWAYIWTYWNPGDKDFTILDLLEPLRQRFQNFGLAGTLASKISEFLDLLEPLRQRFQNFGPTGTLASKISEFGASRLMPRDIRSS